MSPESIKEIEFVMNVYRRQGATPFRRTQYRRLLAILNDIFERNSSFRGNIHSISRNAIIGYWERTKSETDKTRKEKYSVVNCLFQGKKNGWNAPKPRLENKN